MVAKQLDVLLVMLRGEYGRLPGEVNDEVRAKAGIAPEDVITCRPADLLEPELEKDKEEFKDIAKSEEDELSLALFPQVAPKSLRKRDQNFEKEELAAAIIATIAETSEGSLAKNVSVI